MNLEAIDVRLVIAALWIAVMFVWQQGDVLRVYSGDYKPGDDITGGKMSMKTFWVFSAVFMTIPVVMIVLTLILGYGANRWANIIIAGLYTLFNLLSVGTYKSFYDRLLIFIGVVFTGMIVYYAWTWA